MEKKIKREKIMMLNMSACNYKSTVSTSFKCKQIWLPPLFPTVKGSICVIATLEKMNELLKIFFKLLRGFVCHSDHSIDQNVRDLGCLWHSCAPKRLLWAGRAAVAVAHRSLCWASGWVTKGVHCVWIQSTAFPG